MTSPTEDPLDALAAPVVAADGSVWAKPMFGATARARGAAPINSAALKADFPTRVPVLDISLPPVRSNVVLGARIKTVSRHRIGSH
jgi:hypothetical protein